VKDHGARGKKPTQEVLHPPSISRLKARMRQMVREDTVQEVVKHSREKRTVRRLEKLSAA